MMQTMGKKLGMLAATACIGFAVASAHADVVLSWGSTSGYVGNEASIPVGSYGAGIVNSGGEMSRVNLSLNTSANAWNTAGWGTGGYIAFTLTTSDTGSFNLTEFHIQDRASGTGPLNMGLFFSGNGFAAPIGTWSDASSAGTRQEVVTLSGATLLPHTTYTFEIQAIGTTSNSGASIGSGGTYRVISPSLELDGTPVAVVSTPEPASLGLIGLGAFGLLLRRKHSC